MDVTSSPLPVATVIDEKKIENRKMFNKRELDFVADPDEYVVLYPAMDEPTDGYRFWVARAQEHISYETHKRKKATVVYYVAKGNTEYLDFEQESPRKVKVHFKMLLGRLDPKSVTQTSEVQMKITAEERDKWMGVAKALDKEQ